MSAHTPGLIHLSFRPDQSVELQNGDGVPIAVMTHRMGKVDDAERIKHLWNADVTIAAERDALKAQCERLASALRDIRIVSELEPNSPMIARRLQSIARAALTESEAQS